MPLAKAMMEAAGNSTQPVYIEDVFSTYLYTGNDATQTITNGIDLAGKGGLVWGKSRTDGSNSHRLQDTARGVGNEIFTNLTNAQNTGVTGISSFNSNGFTLSGSFNNWNSNGANYASWTFRKQPKFFDVVTYTGDGTSNRQIPHSLGSVPGAMIVKTVSTTGYWWVYHRSLANTEYLELNGTYAKATSANMWASTTPTDTYFTVSAGTNLNNTSGTTYVAYLFAHDAGGFGLTGTDNVISCGSYTGNGSTSGPVVTLGYEPQWLLVKDVTTTKNWYLVDSMRGMAVGGASKYLVPNLSNAEGSVSPYISPTATGFQIATTDSSVNFSGDTYIYIAIRRGPMKTPTSATSVFAPVFASSSGPYTATAGFPVDLNFYGNKSNTDKWFWFDRLRGTPYLQSNTTGAESASTGKFDSNTAFSLTATGDFSSFINYAFRRAPGFFDEVCYEGNGVAGRAVKHNLTVSPELLIIKRRNTIGYAPIWSKSIGNDYILKLFDTQTFSDDPKDGPTTVQFNQTAPTASVFTLGDSSSTNAAGTTYVAWMWATCPGVSSVGSYTGTGTTQQINCGFTGGARFVLIKRTDSTGDWYVWDSARGIVAGNDPYLLLNSTAAEVTSTDYVDTYSAGFEISSTAPAAINASGGTFIYLAIA